MRAIDWNLIRERHYGQRSCEPRKQPEHMAAPTNAANVQESPCQLGAVHTWPLADIPAALLYVCYSLNSDQKADFATAVANGRQLSLNVR
jgi:hypothetical protein